MTQALSVTLATGPIGILQAFIDLKNMSLFEGRHDN